MGVGSAMGVGAGVDVGSEVGVGVGVNVGSEVGLGVAVGNAATAACRRASTVASMSGLGLVSGVGMAALTAAATAASISMVGPGIAVGAEPVQAHAMDPNKNSTASKRSLPKQSLPMEASANGFTGSWVIGSVTPCRA